MIVVGRTERALSAPPISSCTDLGADLRWTGCAVTSLAGRVFAAFSMRDALLTASRLRTSISLVAAARSRAKSTVFLCSTSQAEDVRAQFLFCRVALPASGLEIARERVCSLALSCECLASLFCCGLGKLSALHGADLRCRRQPCPCLQRFEGPMGRVEIAL